MADSNNTAEAERQPSPPHTNADSPTLQNQEVIVHPRRAPGARSWPWAFATAGLALLLAPITYLWPSAAPIDPLDYAARTKQVLKTTALIDGHNDLPWLLRVELQNRIRDEKFDPRQKLLGHTDIQRMKSGMMGGQFWSVYVHCDESQNHFEDPSVS